MRNKKLETYFNTVINVTRRCSVLLTVLAVSEDNANARAIRFLFNNIWLVCLLCFSSCVCMVFCSFVCLSGVLNS